MWSYSEVHKHDHKHKHKYTCTHAYTCTGTCNSSDTSNSSNSSSNDSNNSSSCCYTNSGRRNSRSADSQSQHRSAPERRPAGLPLQEMLCAPVAQPRCQSHGQ